MIARNHQRLNADPAQFIKLTDDIRVTQLLTVLCQVASDQDQIRFYLVFDLGHHLVKQRLAVVHHLSLATEVVCPSFTLADQ